MYTFKKRLYFITRKNTSSNQHEGDHNSGAWIFRYESKWTILLSTTTYVCSSRIGTKMYHYSNDIKSKLDRLDYITSTLLRQ